MKSGKELKKAARLSLKSHFFMNILIVFIVGIIINGGYHYATKNDSKDDYSHLEGQSSNAEIIEEVIENQDIIDVDIKADTNTKKYTRGVLSTLINEISGSQSLVFGILNGVNKILFKGKVVQSVIIFSFTILSFLIFIFLKNIIEVGMNRYFLEHRRYTETKADRILFVYRSGQTRNVAFIMLSRYIFQTLWNFTVIGGIIKHYEYLMIPYILAENPKISKKEAFELSKQMMQGQKWNTFKLDLSLIGWRILAGITYNVLNFFFVQPYIDCIYAELYMNLRGVRKGELSCGGLLNDDALANEVIVTGEYPKQAYRVEFVEGRDWLTIDYMRDYSIMTLILFFFTFSFTGWVWEVMLHLIHGQFVNRGTMFGPWLPIYGAGGLLILIVLKPLRDKPFRMFLGAFVLCGIVEYFTAWFLETFRHMRWWNYKGYFMNLHGRICLEGLLVFGLAGVGFTYIFAPMLDNLFKKLSIPAKRNLCFALIVLFCADMIYSGIHPNTGKGVTSKLQNETDYDSKNRGFHYKNEERM